MAEPSFEEQYPLLPPPGFLDPNEGIPSPVQMPAGIGAQRRGAFEAYVDQEMNRHGGSLVGKTSPRGGGKLVLDSRSGPAKYRGLTRVSGGRNPYGGQTRGQAYETMRSNFAAMSPAQRLAYERRASGGDVRTSREKGGQEGAGVAQTSPATPPPPPPPPVAPPTTTPARPAQPPGSMFGQSLLADLSGRPPAGVRGDIGAPGQAGTTSSASPPPAGQAQRAGGTTRDASGNEVTIRSEIDRMKATQLAERQAFAANPQSPPPPVAAPDYNQQMQARLRETSIGRSERLGREAMASQEAEREKRASFKEDAAYARQYTENMANARWFGTGTGAPVSDELEGAVRARRPDLAKPLDAPSPVAQPPARRSSSFRHQRV